MSGNEALLVLPIIAFVVVIISILVFAASRYKRCPSDKILVVYGKVGTGQSARCIHGGGALVWPLIQDSRFLTLTPMTIPIGLKNALSKQNIRIDVPSTFTVGVSTDPGVMMNAAERLLGLPSREIEQITGEIIFGQLRLTVATLTIEEINQDRERFLESIRENVEPELNKIGLNLINVNITDITDESDYIESIGKKAAATAINQARVDVAEQSKLGEIGQAAAIREKDIRVAENQNEAQKGIKKAESERRIYVQQQEAAAVKGEKQAEADRRVYVQQQEAEAVKGEKQAEADRRVYVQQQEAEAVKGENLSKAAIADYEAQLEMKRAEALQKGEVAKRRAQAEIQKAEYEAEKQRLNAERIVQEETAKRMKEIQADAEAEKTRREARGEADAVLMKYEAEAAGIRKVLESKAEGYQALVQGCAGDAKSAATLLMIEKLEEIVARQVEAIRNLKIDKITVWDSAGGQGSGSTTAQFLSSFIKSLPPLQEIAKMAGVELPEYLGRMVDADEPKSRVPASGDV
jgi:flotillin